MHGKLFKIPLLFLLIFKDAFILINKLITLAHEAHACSHVLMVYMSLFL